MRIDLRKIYGLDPAGMRQRMARVAQVIRNEWMRQASQQLGSTVVEYNRAIQVTEVSERRARVELRGTVPNIVEQGMGPGGVGTYTGAQYDLRKFVLKPGTSNLRRSERGMYVNVPFGHTAASITKMGGPGALKAAQALSPTLSRPGEHRTVWGGRLGPGWAQKIAAHHATDPLHGLVRMQKTYSKATQGGPPWRTWRRMTEWGKPWLTKGVKPRRIAVSVQKAIRARLAEVF